MKNVHFIKSPGYTYDLFFLFILYFNKDYCYRNFVNGNKRDEDIAFINKTISEFGEIPDELLPFFYLRDDNLCFMTQCYFNPYRKLFTTTYKLASVQEALMNYDCVVTNLLKFYFPNITDVEVEECKKSTKALNKQIKDSHYSCDIKNSLYVFFLDPVPTIQKLSYELIAKEFLLSKQYNNEQYQISVWQKNVDIDKLAEGLKKTDSPSNIDAFAEIYITYCSIAKNHIKVCFYADKVLVFLGSDYEASMKYLLNRHITLELDVLGNALSEKNRIEILDLMHQKQEITIRDITENFKLTSTNAYYHLSLLLKAQVIRSRNQGRTMLYSINKETFDDACSLLRKYANNTKGVVQDEKMEKGHNYNN